MYTPEGSGPRSTPRTVDPGTFTIPVLPVTRKPVMSDCAERRVAVLPCQADVGGWREVLKETEFEISQEPSPSNDDETASEGFSAIS